MGGIFGGGVCVVMGGGEVIRVRDIMSEIYMELKGLHMCHELREGGDIDTTENLEVHKGFALEAWNLSPILGLLHN